MTREDWISRIPVELLDGLAATQTLDRTTQVLIALLAKFFRERENSGNPAPTGRASASQLARMTGRDVRSVERTLASLYRAGVLFDVDAPSGRAKTRGLQPGPKEPAEIAGGTSGRNSRGAETAGGRRNSRGSPGRSNRGSGAEVAGGAPGRNSRPHPYQEIQEPSSGTLDARTPAVADDVGGARSNGLFHGGDIGRQEAVRRLMVAVVDEHRDRLTPKARERWLGHVEELAAEVAGTGMRESLIRRRARDFFRNREWCRLGDSEQAANLRYFVLERSR